MKIDQAERPVLPGEKDAPKYVQCISFYEACTFTSCSLFSLCSPLAASTFGTFGDVILKFLQRLSSFSSSNWTLVHPQTISKMLSPLNTVEKSCSLGERMSRYEQGIGLLSASFLFPEPLMHCFWHLFQLIPHVSSFFPTRPCPSCVSSFCGRWIHTVGVLNLHHRWPWVRELPLGDKGEWIKANLNDMFIASRSQWQAWLTLQLRIRMYLLQISPNPLASALTVHCCIA